MPSCSSREVIADLESDGWELVRTKGSHHQFKHPYKPGVITVPHPKKNLPIGTAKSIYDVAQLAPAWKRRASGS